MELEKIRDVLDEMHLTPKNESCLTVTVQIVDKLIEMKELIKDAETRLTLILSDPTNQLGRLNQLHSELRRK